eukprot:403331016
MFTLQKSEYSTTIAARDEDHISDDIYLTKAKTYKQLLRSLIEVRKSRHKLSWKHFLFYFYGMRSVQFSRTQFDRTLNAALDQEKQLIRKNQIQEQKRQKQMLQSKQEGQAEDSSISDDYSHSQTQENTHSYDFEPIHFIQLKYPEINQQDFKTRNPKIFEVLSLEQEANQILIKSFKEDLKVVKSNNMIKIIEAAADVRFYNKKFWEIMSDFVIYSTSYEISRDIIVTLDLIKQHRDLFSKDIFQTMMDNILMVYYPQFSCHEFIDIISIYKQMRKANLCSKLIENCKHYIVEDIDNLSIQELLTVIEVYKNDKQFKKFIGHQLKEKIVKNQNLQLRELMTSLLETLDLEDLRKEILKYSLNSEIFYAFPISYLISIMNKIFKLEYHPDFYDLLKTMQIQICLQEQQINPQTVEKLIRLHLELPILNPQFLTLLLKQYNLQKSIFKKVDLPVFNLNISLLNLPNQKYQPLIDEYEQALVNYLWITNAQQFNFNILIKFLQENPMFAKYGFYKGFNDLLFQSFYSEERSPYDVWQVSILNKIISLECTDQELFYRIEKQIENNFERYCNNALVKTVMLVNKVSPHNQNYQSILIRRIKFMRIESIVDVKQMTNFLMAISSLMSNYNDWQKSQFSSQQNNEIFIKFLNQFMINIYQFNIYDIRRILQSMNNLKINEMVVQQAAQSLNTPTQTIIQNHYTSLLERTKQLGLEMQMLDLINQMDLILQIMNWMPASDREAQLKVFSVLVDRMTVYLEDKNKRVLMLYMKYKKILPKAEQSLAKLDKNDPLQEFKPRIKHCIEIIDQYVSEETSLGDYSSEEEAEDSFSNRNRNRLGSRQFNSNMGDNSGNSHKQMFNDKRNRTDYQI